MDFVSLRLCLPPVSNSSFGEVSSPRLSAASIGLRVDEETLFSVKEAEEAHHTQDPSGGTR